MGRKGLDTLLLSDVPQLRKRVASTRHKLVVVKRVDAQAHDIAEMVGKLVYFGAGFQVPEHTGHVAGRGQDALVADKSAATQVARVARQLARDACWAFAGGEVVDGADVVEATAGDVVARGRVGAGHDPRGAQGDGVDLVGCVCVPDDELSVLRGRDEMPSVRGPVHGVDFGEMALEGALRLHGEARQSLDAVSSNIADWTGRVSSGQARASSGGEGPAQDVRVVSASSSFFRFILSLRASASRRAIWIFCWMDSWFMSAMLCGRGGTGERGGEAGRSRGRRECGSPGTEARTGAGDEGGQQWRQRRARQEQLGAQRRRRRTAVVGAWGWERLSGALAMGEVRERPGGELGLSRETAASQRAGLSGRSGQQWAEPTMRGRRA